MNLANRNIHEILIQEFMILEIGLDDYFLEGWNYISPYPLVILPQEVPTLHGFLIRLFRYDSNLKSLHIVDLKFHSAPEAKIIYIRNEELRDGDNILGENLTKNERFLSDVKPLLLQGFREQALKQLLK